MDQILLNIFKNKHNVTVALTAAAVLWMVVVIFVAFVPAMKDAFTIRTTYAQAQITNEMLDTKISAINTAKKLLKQESENTDVIASALPQTDKVVTFMNAISSLATNNQIVLTKLDYNGVEADSGRNSVDQTTTPKTTTTLSFDLIAEGEFPGMSSFVSQVESLPRVSKITSISIQRNKEDETGGEGVFRPLTLNLKGEFFFE